MGILGWYPAWMKWHWADSPDGEDCFKKVVWAGKWTSAWGAYFAMANTNAQVISGHLVISNWGIWASSFLRLALPVACVGPLYASVTCLSASFRGKDDIRNHVYGGISTGAMWYVVSKKWHTAVIYAFWISLGAAIIQARRIDGDQFEFIPNDYLLTNLPQRAWHSRGPLLDLSSTRDYKPMNNQYYFPAAAERVSEFAVKPYIITAYPATQARVEYNGP